MERNYARRQGTWRPGTQEAFVVGGCPLGFAVVAHGHGQSAIAPAEDVRCETTKMKRVWACAVLPGCSGVRKQANVWHSNLDLQLLLMGY